MRKYAWILSLTLAACNPKAWVFTSFREPANGGLRLLTSRDARHWTDSQRTVLVPEKGKVLRDPSIAQGKDGMFHVVWTSAWKGERQFGYARSADLIHWSEPTYIPVMEQEPTTVNVWAPELFYDEDNNRFLIIWASTVPHRFEKGVEAEDNNHRLYYIETSDFQTFSPTRLFFDPGFSAIDAVIVRRKKDDYVLVFKDNTRPERNLRVAFSAQAAGPYTRVSAPFTGKLTEGPTVVRTGKEYLIYFDDYGNKRFGCMKTIDFQAFVDISGDVSLPEGHKHGTILRLPEKVRKKGYEANQ